METPLPVAFYHFERKLSEAFRTDDQEKQRYYLDRLIRVSQRYLKNPENPHRDLAHDRLCLYQELSS